MRRTRYTPEQLESFWHQDLLNDAKCSEEQALVGPYYPEKGITQKSLLEYAEKCRKQAKLPIPPEFSKQKF